MRCGDRGVNFTIDCESEGAGFAKKSQSAILRVISTSEREI
jgi:hypothetical protein